MKKKIAIIGAGIAGLTLANLLKANSDFEFVIYEKGEIFNFEEGYGVQLSVNGISILNKIGFNQQDKNEKYHPLQLDFYSINFNKICHLDLTKFNSESEKYTTLKRSILIKFLKDKLLSNSIIFRKKINKVEKINDKINIYFTDGLSDMVDYLVVADGVFSNTKSVIEKKKIVPVYSGAVAFRIQVKNQNIFNFNSKNISLVMGSDAHIVLYPINQRGEINLVCIVRKKLDKEDTIKALLENTILKQNKNLANLFKGDLKSWPIYTSSKPVKSIYENVLYAGDAFYAFSPTMAQGASQAIESANEIFELINNNNQNIQNKYFKNRIKKTDLINKRTKINYFGFHITNPLLKILRNFFLKRLVKNKNFIQSYLGKIYQ
tara:strand:+ start:1008 stop:2138 length:1131 start_codon:yes stop_codon:yes gene_type:complete